jgi:hypothetical protein
MKVTQTHVLRYGDSEGYVTRFFDRDEIAEFFPMRSRVPERTFVLTKYLEIAKPIDDEEVSRRIKKSLRDHAWLSMKHKKEHGSDSDGTGNTCLEAFVVVLNKFLDPEHQQQMKSVKQLHSVLRYFRRFAPSWAFDFETEFGKSLYAAAEKAAVTKHPDPKPTGHRLMWWYAVHRHSSNYIANNVPEVCADLNILCLLFSVKISFRSKNKTFQLPMSSAAGASTSAKHRVFVECDNKSRKWVVRSGEFLSSSSSSSSGGGGGSKPPPKKRTKP